MMRCRAARWTLSRYSSNDSVSENTATTWLETPCSETGKCSSLHVLQNNEWSSAVPLPTYFQRTTTRTCHGQSPASSQYVRYIPHLIFPLAAWQWNRLPPNVVLLPTLNQFSVAVRSLDHQTQQTCLLT